MIRYYITTLQKKRHTHWLTYKWWVDYQQGGRLATFDSFSEAEQHAETLGQSYRIQSRETIIQFPKGNP